MPASNKLDPMQPTHDLFGWVGATLDGKYRIDESVGQGGFGVVYRAHHLGFDQTVAIKCLRLPQTLTGTERERFRDTFLAEGRLLHQLSRATAGIVQALDLGAAVSPNKHWTPYLVLEWLDGVPLDRDFNERRGTGRPLAEAVRLLASAARALGVAHAQGVAHRDIKPANLFLAKVAGQNVVKVLDFGIAKVMSESESVTKAFEETGGSMQAFTARYGAPEQFSRRYGATGPWTDVFSLALVFVEAVSGRQALDGRDAAQLFVAAADTEQRPTLRGLGAESSDEVEAVLMRALAVDPRARYATASEFWDALEAAAQLDTPELGSGKRRALGSRADSDPEPPKARVNPDTPGWIQRDPNAPTSVEPAHAATDLSASRQLAELVQPAPVAHAASGLSVGRVAMVGAAALVMGLSLTIAVRLFTSHDAASPSPSAALEGATSAQATSRVSVSPAPQAATPAKSAPPPPQQPPPAPAPTVAEAAQAAPSATAATPAKSAALAGVPTRDVSAGPVGRGYIGGYRLLAREATAGLDFYGAVKQCADVGLSLCSDSQWIHACAAFPELSAVPSWTSTLKGESVILRGGPDCASEGKAAPVERALSRSGICCERAIAMTTDNLQKPYLVTTAERVLAIERALNQRNVHALLELADTTVVVDEQPKTQAELRTLIEADFRAAPELIVLNDVCDVSVQAKKVTKGTKRKKKIVYQTQGWTAECTQSAILPGKSVTQHHVTYAFSAASKLREIVTKPED